MLAILLSSADSDVGNDADRADRPRSVAV